MSMSERERSTDAQTKKKLTILGVGGQISRGYGLARVFTNDPRVLRGILEMTGSM